MTKRELSVSQELALGLPQEAFVDPSLLEEYRLLRRALRLSPQEIAYPACGYDITPSRAFSESRITYLDTDEGVVDAIQRAGLSNGEAIRASLFDTQLSDVDVLILRNATVGVENEQVIEHVSPWVREGGHVIFYQWITNEGAVALSGRHDMVLVGSIPPRFRVHERPRLVISDARELQERLASGKPVPGGAFFAPTYVFRRGSK